MEDVRTLNDAPIENEVVDVAEQVPVKRRVLGREAILTAKELSIEEVPVPEWGGEGAVVLVGPMSSIQRDKFEVFISDETNESRFEGLRAKVAGACIVDEQGQRLFTDDDIPSVGSKNAMVLARVFDVVLRLSGMSEEDVEELEKN